MLNSPGEEPAEAAFSAWTVWGGTAEELVEVGVEVGVEVEMEVDGSSGILILCHAIIWGIKELPLLFPLLFPLLVEPPWAPEGRISSRHTAKLRIPISTLSILPGL